MQQVSEKLGEEDVQNEDSNDKIAKPNFKIQSDASNKKFKSN